MKKALRETQTLCARWL